MGNVVMLVVGFVLLVCGADKFVEGASELAKKMGIPTIIIGLTVVAFGTSSPELIVSLLAGLQGSNEIAIGNVLGSNIFNLLVVVGGSAIVAPLVVEKSLLHRDWIYSILGSILLGALMLWGGNISRIDAILLLSAFAMVLIMQIRVALQARNIQNTVSESGRKKRSKWQTFIYIFIGFIGIIAGGKLAVTGATEIARMLEISETIIGLTVVAIGTSLPELVTSVVATKRGENAIAIGNVIGSNIFNVLFILGVSALCTPIQIQLWTIYDLLVLVAINIVMCIIGIKGYFNRRIGVGMVVSYIGYTVWIIIR